MRLAKGSFGSRAALTAALLAVGYFTFTTASVAQAKGKKNKEHKIHGHVISVTAGSTKGTYTLTIDVHHHHKKGVDAGPQVSEQRSFTITDSTTIKKAEKDAAPVAASIADLTSKPKEHVSVELKDGNVVSVTIGHHHHHKKKVA